MRMKKLAAGVALTTLASLAATAAWAQSAGTQAVQEIVVTASRQSSLGGLVVTQEAPKTREVISQAYISTQLAGGNAFSQLNLLPGINFTQDDPFGLAGSAGHISIRGLKGANIGEMEDGMPLNDAGNYAVYAGERLDPEVLGSVNVITGSSEVDAPSASSLGGTINYNSLMPTAKAGGLMDASGGSFGEYRVAGLVQTGEFGPWATKGWAEASYTQDNKFTTGFGRDYKWQVNGKLYQDLHHDGDFVSIAAFYDQQLLSNYDGVDFASSGNTATHPVTTAGYNYHGLLTTPWNSDYNQYFIPGAAGSNAANSAFQGLQLNPTNTANVRGSFLYTLLPTLKLAVDPSYQYVVATGGTLSGTIAGTDPLLIGNGLQTVNKSNYPACYNAAGQITGINLDGGATCSDVSRITNPSLTQTQRFTVNSNLIWTPLPGQLVQLSYSYDHANVRQTAEYAQINQSNGWPTSVFSGLQGFGGAQILGVDGNVLERRNRLTIADLNQVSLEYIGKFFDDHLRLDLGVRDPFISRNLNQYCYTNPPSTAYCTTFPSAATAARATVLPFTIHKTYNQPLPNVGATWNFDSKNSVFVDYTEALNAPVNDDLYAIGIIGTGGTSTTNPGADNVKPETSRTIEGGYRYQASNIKLTVAAYYIEDNNHIVSAFNQLTQDSVDTNVGSIHFYGVEFNGAWIPMQHLTLFGSVSYEKSTVENNIPFSATVFLPTAGKQFYDTPPLMVSARAQYDWGPVSFGGQFKYVDARYVTAENDLQVPSYKTVDIDIRWKLDWLRPGTYAQLNVDNLFNEKYIGSINYGTTNNSNNVGYSEPYAYQGAPTTVQGTIRVTF